MKKIEVSEEFYNAAQRLAEYVDNEDSEYDAFKQWIEDGNDPKDSIYYCAAIVGEWLDQLEIDA